MLKLLAVKSRRGGERDAGTGLDYRGARFYDADVGRFLSLDPLAADFASWSPYNYVLGNPIALIDPTGKAPEHGDDPPEKQERERVNSAVGGAAAYVEQVFNAIYNGVEAVGNAYSNLLGALYNEVRNLFPDEGNTSAEDYHDDSSSEKKGSGNEVMTGQNNKKSAGTIDTDVAANGSTSIVDGVFAPGGGQARSFIKARFPQPAPLFNSAAGLKEKVESTKASTENQDLIFTLGIDTIFDDNNKPTAISRTTLSSTGKGTIVTPIELDHINNKN